MVGAHHLDEQHRILREQKAATIELRKVVDERTGQPTGAGVGFGRYLLEAVAGGISGGLLLIVDLLWPLWDDTKQTLHDKIVHTIVVRGD